jgi:predicted membrane protein
MKMSMGIFWGIVLVLIGISIIIKIVFNIDFPVFKFLVAFFFIYIGVRIMVGNFNFFSTKVGSNDVVFSDATMNDSVVDGKEYNVVFGKGRFDFRNVELKDNKSIKLEVNTVFGESKIMVNPAIPFRINVSAAFAGAKLPNGNTTAFGETYYQSPDFDSTKPYLLIETNVVFGALHIIQ